MSDLHLLYKAARSIRSWIRRHRLWSLLIALTFASALAYKPVLKKWRQHEAHKTAARAMDLMKLGKWKEATPLLEEAYRTYTADPAIVRACIYYERNGARNPAFTSHFLRQMVLMGLANSEDKAILSQSLLEQGLFHEALKYFESIPAADRNTSEVLEAESEFLRKKGDIQSADALLRKALLMKPDQPRNQLKLAMLDMSSGNAERQQESLNSLWSLARTDFYVAHEAIEKLAIHPVLTEIQSEDLLNLVSKKDIVSEKLRHEVVSCYMRFHPEMREEVLDQEIARSATALDEKFRYLCVWLVFEKEYDRLLKLLPQDKVVKDAKIFPIYVETLVRQGKWVELSDFLKIKNLPTIPLDLAQLRARCAYELKEPSAVVREQLIAAQVHAVSPKSPLALHHIAGVAEKMGYPDIAIDCLLGIHSPSTPLSEDVAKRILRLQGDLGDLAGMIATLRQLDFKQRGSIALAETSIYLKLLSGVELETVMDECDRLTAQGIISENSHEFFKAFAAYRNRDAEILKAALDRTDPSSFSPNWRAVYAGLLSSVGESARAYQIAEKIETALIMEQERRLLAKAL